jgi:hypothetical protein
MSHTLDIQKLPQVFEALQENTHKLTPWECDRLEEWVVRYERDPGAKIFTDPDSRVMEIIERMYLKV